MKKIFYAILIIVAIGLAVTLFGNRASQDKVLAKDINALFPIKYHSKGRGFNIGLSL